jgi:hypothetical protein
LSRGFIDGEYQDGQVRGLNLIVGLRGYGKTTLTIELLASCTGGVLFFDTLGKHAHLFPGYVVISDPAQLVEYLRPNRGRRFRVLFTPRKGDLMETFRAVCKIVIAFGWMVFAVDEVDKFCSNKFSPSMMPPELYDLVNYGRHHRLAMLATARRPSTVAPGYRDESEFWIFRLKSDVADKLEGDVGRDTVEQVVNLPKYFYLRCQPDGEPLLCGGPRNIPR